MHSKENSTFITAFIATLTFTPFLTKCVDKDVIFIKYCLKVIDKGVYLKPALGVCNEC